MTDDDRCKRIAEFENLDPWARTTIGPRRNKLPDYSHDLNATMRAARKLPPLYGLIVGAHGYAYILAPPASGSHKSETRRICESMIEDDPARAAFLAISDWIAKEHKP